MYVEKVAEWRILLSNISIELQTQETWIIIAFP